MNNYLITIIICALALGIWLLKLWLQSGRQSEQSRYRTCYHCGKAHCGTQPICDDCYERKS